MKLQTATRTGVDGMFVLDVLVTGLEEGQAAELNGQIESLVENFTAGEEAIAELDALEAEETSAGALSLTDDQAVELAARQEAVGYREPDTSVLPADYPLS